MLSKRIRKYTFNSLQGKIYQDEFSIFNIHAPNTRAPIFLKETLLKLKRYIVPHTIIVGDFNPHSHQWADHGNSK